jgi:hypothetical protein
VLLAAELEKVRGAGCERALVWRSAVVRRAERAPRVTLRRARCQVAAELGDAVRIVKVDTDAEPDLSSQLQARPAAKKCNARVAQKAR